VSAAFRAANDWQTRAIHGGQKRHREARRVTSERPARIVRDPRFERLLPADSALRRIADGFIWSEGPVWLPDEDALLWSDIPNNRVLRWSAPHKTVQELYRPSDFANGHTLDHDGRVLACEHGTRRVARYERDGSRTTVVDRYQGKRLNSPNDIVVASDGAIWFTDPPYGIISDVEGYTAESELGACYVFRFEPRTGELEIVSDDLIDPNGLAFSPDEQTLYVSDTSSGRVENGHHHILAFDVVDGRSLARPRVFKVIDPGVSDGFRVDVEGNVWTSAGDGVHVLAADATELGRLLLPDRVGNLTFGGPKGRTLFIAATSTVWSIRVGIRGAVTPWVHGPA
jgi:gluconolactonase